MVGTSRSLREDTVTKEEQELLNKLARMKRENELLMVIFEELDELIKSGYSGSIAGEEAGGVTFAMKEYKKWKNEAPVANNTNLFDPYDMKN